MSQVDSRTYIIILNWNGWKDTIECLESVFRLDHHNFVAVICDNASTDGSLERIQEWAAGARLARPASPESFHALRAVRKPIPVATLEVSQLNETHPIPNDARVVLIKSDRNLGFAGGNNLCLRYVLARNDSHYIWLLNNDTVVQPDALAKLIQRMEEEPRIGLCGSKLCFYAEPHLIQACGGGTYSPITGRNRHIGSFRPASIGNDRDVVEHQLKYVVAASMLVSRRFLECVGLMSEDYFLYYEELDWAMRGKNKFLQAYAPESVVFHKQGASMGGHSLARNKGPQEDFVVSDYYSARNQIRFTRRYYPSYLPVVGITVIWRLLKRVGAGKWKRALYFVRGVMSAFTGELLDPVVGEVR